MSRIGFACWVIAASVSLSATAWGQNSSIQPLTLNLKLSTQDEITPDFKTGKESLGAKDEFGLCSGGFAPAKGQGIYLASVCGAFIGVEIELFDTNTMEPLVSIGAIELDTTYATQTTKNGVLTKATMPITLLLGCGDHALDAQLTGVAEITFGPGLCITGLNAKLGGEGTLRGSKVVVLGTSSVSAKKSIVPPP
ncbi:MAG TPA: hypothetical protein VMR86_16800 [Myxococcota bacterium]|nr:hypothetical protein [Myxococcota bacterium]